ncbi:MAG TPA: hypothetical protein PLY19_12075, partial [Rhodoglobus sp.]|nr:hypothetical protein [Rhodoglobus sp.]
MSSAEGAYRNLPALASSPPQARFPKDLLLEHTFDFWENCSMTPSTALAPAPAAAATLLGALIE